LIALCVVGAVMAEAWIALFVILPLAWMLWKYLTLRCRVFEVTHERLRIYDGVLNQEIEEIELYRVKDSNILRPFWIRIFGLSTIKLDTSDRSMPEVTLEAVKDGMQVRERIRKQVEILRDRKRVREVDFDGADDEGGLEFEN
jgi:uncharacterized membrane protein YdbT with pleckstrin-like domain